MPWLVVAAAACTSTGEGPLASEVAWSEFADLTVVHAVSLADGGRVEYAASGDSFARVMNRDTGHLGCLVCFGANGERRWRVDEPPPLPLPTDADLESAFHTSRFSVPVELEWGAATLVADAAQVYVVQWNELSDGADVIAFDLSTGARRWARPVQGLGEVVHSRYTNDVRARLVGGALVVFGHEGAGDYTEAWTPHGERLWTRKVE